MARESTITQEQINAAADAIRATGLKPTARAVRESVGGGSMATILKYLQVWQNSQVRAEETPVVLPAGLQRTLVDFVGQQVAAAKADLQSDLLAAQQANTDLIAENERQASALEAQAEALETVQVDKAALAGRLAQVESDLARSTDDVAGERQAAEHARTELAKAQLRLEALPRIEAEADRLRNELGAERSTKVAAEQAAAVAAEKAAGLAARLADAQARVAELETLEQSDRAALEKAAERERGLSERMHHSQSELLTANAATGRATEAERRALAMVAELEKQLADIQKRGKASSTGGSKPAQPAKGV